MAVVLPHFAPEKTPAVLMASLSLVGKSHSLRCDAKQAENRFAEFERFITSVDHFRLGDYLPSAFIKGSQPSYIESLDPEGVPVISTLTIQDLSICTDLCRYITQEEYDAIADERKPRNGDVLLTMDGGTSIGKPAVFHLPDDYAIDSHVAILRPTGISPKLVAYLLASPLGRLQFQQAESGASGQTSVAEDDVRRFRFPVLTCDCIERVLNDLDSHREDTYRLKAELQAREEKAWLAFSRSLLSETQPLKG